MSREALKDFLYAVERSPRLRQAVQACGSDEALIALATSNGFQVRSSTSSAMTKTPESATGSIAAP